MIAIALTTLMSCAKEEITEPTSKKLRNASTVIQGQWVMQSYSIDGYHTFGDNSLWNFSNSSLVLIDHFGESSYSYSSNGSRIYVVDDVNDMVLEYFIDYLDNSIMTLSIDNKTYTFTRY